MLHDILFEQKCLDFFIGYEKRHKNEIGIDFLDTIIDIKKRLNMFLLAYGEIYGRARADYELSIYKKARKNKMTMKEALQVIEYIENGKYVMSEWEHNFLESIKNWRGSLTEAQSSVLRNIYGKSTGFTNYEKKQII